MNATEEPSSTTPIPTGRPTARFAIGALLAVVVILLTIVIVTPIALSSQDLIDWAGAPTGLNLPHPWPLAVFISLDAAAGVCVLLTVYCAWRGEPAGIFGVLVWCFALASAIANLRHGLQPDAAPDAVWFFPLMSLAGPALLEAVLGRFRRWFQRQTGRRNRAMPAFGWRRWTPGLGAPRDTYGAYRTALLLGIDTVEASIRAYHQLCPDGSLRVAAALRNRDANASTAGTTSDDAPYVPVDLMRRIPATTAAYQRWLTVWADLTTQTDPDLETIARRHDFSRRQIEFIRSAGRLGLLDSPVPPVQRLTQTAATDTSRNNTDAAGH